jgi:hypothetical protein
MNERYPAFRSGRALARIQRPFVACSFVVCVANEPEHVANPNEPS